MGKEKMGVFIAELRHKKGMTQKALAACLGVTDKAVSKWERGLSYPDIELLDKIAKILDVTVTELLEGEKRKAESSAVAAGEEGAVEALLKQATEQVQTFKKKDFFASILSLVLCAASLAVVFYTVVSREKSLQNFDFTCILGAVISESVLFMAIGAFASFLALHRPKALWLRAIEFVCVFLPALFFSTAFLSVFFFAEGMPEPLYHVMSVFAGNEWKTFAHGGWVIMGAWLVRSVVSLTEARKKQ